MECIGSGKIDPSNRCCSLLCLVDTHPHTMNSNTQKIKTHYGVTWIYFRQVQKADKRQPELLTLEEWKAVPDEQRHLGRYDEDKNVVLMTTKEFPVVAIHAGGPALFRRQKAGMAVLPAIPE